ncbi:MAG TPA: hypothetical protein PLE24_03875 [Chitinispirillaceae bacterium]|jgi:hypothetical protein|nr:hypothetical protein [Chitinispirillaceae bacterium]
MRTSKNIDLIFFTAQNYLKPINGHIFSLNIKVIRIKKRIFSIVYNGKPSFDFINSIEPLFAIIEETREFVPDFRKIVLDLTVFEPETIEEGSPSAGYCGGL